MMRRPGPTPRLGRHPGAATNWAVASAAIWNCCGAGRQLAALTPEEIQASGDHELLHWIIALGIMGDIPAEIVEVRESHTQFAFRVAAMWEEAGA